MAETFNIMIAHDVRSGRSRSGLNIKKLTYIFSLEVSGSKPFSSNHCIQSECNFTI